MVSKIVSYLACYRQLSDTAPLMSYTYQVSAPIVPIPYMTLSVLVFSGFSTFAPVGKNIGTMRRYDT